MSWLILADAATAAQQSGSLSAWALLFSGIAALGGIAAASSGIFSAVYTTTFTRRKADRELLATKLESLYGELQRNRRRSRGQILGFC
jgi:hypothetical protein